MNTNTKSYADTLIGGAWTSLWSLQVQTQTMMLLVLVLACCARAAPTSLRCFSDSELDGYCRRRHDDDCELGHRGGLLTEAYAFIEPVKDSLFPETFEYVHKGLDGVETTTTQVLFGDLIAAVEDDSARTKDFKPGTNAQRHRFYHIHQHGRNSSRLTDLIRSSFRRVNVSGVDDKEPAASEPPVAAQPAARRQLTWRASAPDYGTI